ncbi:flagellar biosynthesis protein [Dyella acidiphila]|uniref:Flagellar biosynthesis protein n=1 Tax=Dyella acidiphila TaxID=2775866 RepID=A0ABR9G653_9GAMM|nr:flagellar biosynthesis protein [Dyella acidiphila]MBE1159489.1 flagellar biosynthesis protein [Dyella acidiphila]
MSTPLLPAPQRKVVLRLPGGADGGSGTTHLNAAEVDNLFKHAHALGLPLHHDAQIAALLVSLRMNSDVPPLLYAAAAAVLASIYEASRKP